MKTKLLLFVFSFVALCLQAQDVENTESQSVPAEITHLLLSFAITQRSTFLKTKWNKTISQYMITS